MRVLTLSLAAGVLPGFVHELQAETHTVTAIPASNSPQLTVSPNWIVLLSPPNNGALDSPMTFSWQGSSQFHSYKILFFDDVSTLNAYLAGQVNPLVNPSSGQNNAPAGEICTGTGVNRKCQSSTELNPGPFFTDNTTSPSYTLADNLIASCDSQHLAKCKTFVTGEIVAWMVVATDASGNVTFSEARSVALQPKLDSLNGLPKYLDIGGFRVYVNSYQSGASADNFSGQGWTVFRREGTIDASVGAVNNRTQIPLSFQALKGDLEREIVPVGGIPLTKRRIRIGQAVLKANITSGDIQTKFSPAVGLNFNFSAKQGWDYKLDLKSLWLKSAPSGAVADFTLHISHVAIDGSEQTVALDNTTLEPGGDFYREVDGSQIPTIYLGAAQGLPPIGKISQAGKLVVAFSQSTTYTGGLLTADTFVVLAGGSAVIDASSLFPMTDAASITTSYTTMYLSPHGPYGKLKVQHSTPIHPVVPAGYELAFTDGALGVSAGPTDLIDLPEPTFAGMVKFPSKVRSAGGLAASGTFQGLKPSGSSYIASLQLGQIEWGSGDKPFRLLNAGGTLVVSTSGDPGSGGITIIQGYLESPFEVAPPGASNTTRATSSGTTGASGSGAGGDSYSDNVNLALHASGVSGTITSGILAYQADNRPTAGAGQKATNPNQSANATNASGPTAFVAPPRTTMIGDFHADIGNFTLGFTDDTVTSSSLDGQLVVPKPADFTIDFTGASLTSTGDLLGVRLQTPSSIHLAYWHAQVLLPTTSSAAMARAVTGPGQTNTQTNPNIGINTPVVLALSTSYLQVYSGTLQLLVDPQFGGNEFDAFTINTLQIGADGQIQAAQVEQSSKFLGMDFQLDSADLDFSAGNSEAPVGTQPLVTLAGQLAFPSFGQKHIIVQHTASGADITEINPADLHRGKDNTIKTSAKVQWVNGYAKGMTDKDGKGFKEFIGLGQVAILKMLFLNGVVMIGEDSQGPYDTMALGIGVDVNKAYALYSGGWVSVGAKLGAAGLDYAANGKSTQADNVATLVGDVAKLKNKFDADSVLRTVADAVNLADGIYIDGGGKRNDDVDASLNVAEVTLQVAQAVASSSKRDPQMLAAAIVKALDLAIPILEKASFVTINKDVLNTLHFIHLGVTATRISLENGHVTEAEWLSIHKEMLAVAKILDVDKNYLLALEIVGGVIELAASKDQYAALNMAAAILGAVEKSGLIAGQDAKNVMAVGKGLLDGASKIKGMPFPDNLLTVAQGAFDEASSNDVNYGGRDDATVKKVMRVGSRTLKILEVTSGGIPYDKAAGMVVDTLAEANISASASKPNSPPDKVGVLAAAWSAIKSQSLADSLANISTLLVCPQQKGSAPCTESITVMVNDAAQLVNQASSPTELIYALQRILAAKDAAQQQNTTQDFDTALATYQQPIQNTITGSMQYVTQQLLNATSGDDIKKWTQLGADVQHQTGLLDAKWICYPVPAAGYLGDCATNRFSADVTLTDPTTGKSSTWQSLLYSKGLSSLQALLSDMKALDSSLLGSPNQYVDISWELETFSGKAAALERPFVLQGFGEDCDHADPASVDGQYCSVTTQISTEFQSLTARLRSTALATIGQAATPEDLYTRVYQVVKGIRESDTFYSADNPNPPDFSAVEAAIQPQCQPMLQQIITGVAQAQNNAQTIYWLRDSLRNLAASCIVARIDVVSDLTVPPVPQAKPQVEQYYSFALASLQQATSYADTDAALYLANVLEKPELAAAFGYTSAEVNARVTALATSLKAEAAQMTADILAQMKSAPPDSLPKLATDYLKWSVWGGPPISTLNNAVPAWTDYWIDGALMAPCSQRDAAVGRLTWASGYSTVSQKQQDSIRKTLDDFRMRCSGFTATAAAAAAYTKALQSDAKDANTRLADLQKRLNNGANDEDLKAELAWFIAKVIDDLTAPYSNGQSDAEQAMWKVHKQTDYVLQYKAASRQQQVAAALQMVVETVGDLAPSQKQLATKLAVGLREYADKGTAQQPTTAFLQMIASMSDAFLPNGRPKDMLVGGLFGLTKQSAATQTEDSVVLAVVGVVGTGIAIGLEHKIVHNSSGIDYEATLGQLDSGGSTFWHSVGKDTKGVVALVPVLEQLWNLFSALQKGFGKGTPNDRVSSLYAFVNSASKLPKVGQFFGVITQPDKNLLAPDNKHDNYISNLLLAELGTTRKSLPNGDTVGFKSTCPSVDPSKGLVGGSLSGNGSLFCAIDLARDLIDSSMVGVVDPNSLEGINEREGQAVTEMKQDAVYQQAVGDDNLSGIYGSLTYRNGQFKEFKMEASFTVKGFLEAAMKADWDDSQQQFTLQYDQQDQRTGSLFDSLGLLKGSSRLFDNKVDLGSPIKELFLQFSLGTPINARINLAVNTPFGGYETGEEALFITVTPSFSFDVQATLTWQASVIYSIQPSIELCYQGGNFCQSGNAGLNVGVQAKLEPPALVGPFYVAPRVCALGGCVGGDAEGRGDYSHWWGPYASAGLDMSLQLGGSGVQTGGNIHAIGGIYQTQKDQPHCSDSQFENEYTWDSGQQDASGNEIYINYGNCHYGLGQSFDVLQGVNSYANFYLKARTTINIVIANVDVWVYGGNVGGNPAIDAGTGAFPSKYGGWN